MDPIIDQALKKLRQSARDHKLVTVVGTGVSRAMTKGKSPVFSWAGLIENGFEYGLIKGTITEQQRDYWKNQLSSSDIDDLLGAAEFMSRKLKASDGMLYARWLEQCFKDVKSEDKGMENAILALHSSGSLICTLNYDTLLEKVTGLPTINIGETTKVAAWLRREQEGILHIHGSWDTPSTCILGIRDYETTVSSDIRDLIQRTLTSFSQLLFVGCGDTFSDPNFSALIRWLSDRLKGATPQHYALVSGREEQRRHADPSWRGFVDPISYGEKHENLPEFLLNLFPTTQTVMVKRRSRAAQATPSALKYAKVLADYCAFLVKDCGQMTIEGMRADADTAQRRFDLEKLFVPLKVMPVPPEFPLNDPEREQKLVLWQEKNKGSSSFGHIFGKHKRLALLALPGGGKSLLLKRLAVAYANPDRRETSDDELPALDLMPLMIRCREWKDYIERPIPALIQNIAVITGQKDLAELGDALLPLLKKGKVLLLVDGLDEIHDDAQRSTFVENLETFLREYNRIHLVVTSREAGFDLVAPTTARFCERWKIAPLEPKAIRSLCEHWHRLMTGDAPAAELEASEVADQLLQSDSLRRLAENPLLLTMLLVVKHGAGRLPPDRVSLYDRAVEVLLDTWNIKGHEPLNSKEAVPQLACVAFELMRLGQQTATEKQLLALIEEARERIPQIRRYAKGTPDQFLKRVELRSSLMVEAGHQLDGINTVPFYQFRHLTFQEHLAAVAAAGGHYLEHKKEDTVLTPLQSYLNSDEWKEVIPMAAVLAKKQAEPLLSELVKLGLVFRERVTKEGAASNAWHGMPMPVARLLQCLAEEAEASPETLTAALQLIALFGKGCMELGSWQEICRGPYGEELVHQAWLLYSSRVWPEESWLRNTLAVLASYRHSDSYWLSPESENDVIQLLRSDVVESVVRGALIISGLHWGRAGGFTNSVMLPAEGPGSPKVFQIPTSEFEKLFFSDDALIWNSAIWAWALTRERKKSVPQPPSEVLDRLLRLWIHSDSEESSVTSFAVSTLTDIDLWKPSLSDEEKSFIGDVIGGDDKDTGEPTRKLGALLVAYYAGDLLSEGELARRFEDISSEGDGLGAIIKKLKRNTEE